MTTFFTDKLIINNLSNTMIIKITTKFNIANLSQPDTLQNLADSCKIKIKINKPPTTTFMTKIKVNI